MYLLGKWQHAGVRHPAGERILIRIGSKDPGPHILVKQCPVGTSNDLFAFSGFRAMAAVTRFWWQQSVSSSIGPRF
jgi:hypothetical protein